MMSQTKYSIRKSAKSKWKLQIQHQKSWLDLKTNIVKDKGHTIRN